MSDASSVPPRKQQFGRRKDLHRIIIAKGDQVTSVTIHPVIAATGIFVTVALAIAYLGATGYLMFRDDLLNASRIRQVRIQNAYEDQLATLRIEIDRIASRQMLDQKSVENKLDRLLGLRASLDERQRAVTTLSQSASAAGIVLPTKAPNPRPHPQRAEHASAAIDQLLTGSNSRTKTSGDLSQDITQTAFAGEIRTTKRPPIDLNAIETNLQNEQRGQFHQLRLMAKKTVDKSKNIAAVIRSLGFKAPADPPHSVSAIGGPFEAASTIDPIAFDSSLLALEENVAHLSSLKKKVQRFPLRRPLKTGTVSSRFGKRVDPFLGRYAMHSGLDFKAPTGTSVYATGPGKVVKASWTGGYGRLVEIEHAGGIRTRYAHLSRISVKKGQYVEAGAKIGKVGSTGRSTGPHLHYETRMGKKPLNPSRFIKAGKRIGVSL